MAASKVKSGNVITADKLVAAVAQFNANERQVGGDHYKNGGEEHWDRVARLGLNYFEGQITKYTERARKKNGVEDLKKARHFIDKYIELAEAGLIDGFEGAL